MRSARCGRASLVEVEVDSLGQLTEVLEAGADLVLLDNFTPEQMRLAVAIAKPSTPSTAGTPRARCWRPAAVSPSPTPLPSGATGVDYVSVGALTHSAPVLDVGADLRPLTPQAPE